MIEKDSAIIISGGSKGIGLAMAKLFARTTAHPLVLLARSEDDLKEAKKVCLKEGASKVDVIAADLTDGAQISAIDFSQYNPGLLINNAGSFLFKELADTSFKEFNSQYEINTLSAFHLTQAVLPVMKKSGKRALIVNICSMGSLTGMGDSGAYSMSKHALLGYTRSLRKELMDSEIGVTAINLGQTYSTSWHDVDVDKAKLIDPEDVGKLILTLSQLSKRTTAEEITLMPQGGKIAPM